MGISITPKVHLLCEHLEEVCEYYGFGMALLNESAGKAIHADFAKHYQGYAVKDQESDSYQKKLLHAVKTNNSNQCIEVLYSNLELYLMTLKKHC